MFRFILLIMVLALLLGITLYAVDRIDHPMDKEDHVANQSQIKETDLLYAPPLQTMQKIALSKGRSEQIILPKNEVAVQKFKISLEVPAHYQSLVINEQQHAFYPKEHLHLLDGQNNISDGMILLESGCFGECNQVAQNLERIMERDLYSLNYQNYLTRTIYRKVHKKGRFDYVFWYKDHEGKHWFYGRSIYGHKSWLEAISCQYFEIVEINQEDDQSFKKAWLVWSAHFHQYCQSLQVQGDF